MRMTNARVSSPGSRAMPRRAPPISQADETTKRLLFPRRSGRTAPMMTGSGSRLDPRALPSRARAFARSNRRDAIHGRARDRGGGSGARARVAGGRRGRRARERPRLPPPFVDRCDACAAAGYALHDAMLYQQAKLRARHGSDARLADVADARKATAAAVESACDTRGHWLRYGVKSMRARTAVRPSSPSPAPASTRTPPRASPFRTTTRPASSRQSFYAREVRRGGGPRERRRPDPRLQRHRARVDAPAASSDPRVIDDVDLDDLSLTDDDDDDTHLPLDDARVAESSAAFAFALCVRGEWDTSPPAPAPRRGETAATRKPAPAPCLAAATRAKARAVMDAARAAQETTFAFTRAAEETDENAEGEGSLGGSLGSLGRFARRDDSRVRSRRAPVGR